MHDARKVVQEGTPALRILVPVRCSVNVALGAVGPEDGPDLLCLPPLVGGLPPWQRPVQLHTQHAHQTREPIITAGTFHNPMQLVFTAIAQTPDLQVTSTQ